MKLPSRYLRNVRRLAKPTVLRGFTMEIAGLAYLWSRPRLWRELQNASKVSPSTGCNYAELTTLHRAILRKKPEHVLELGSGISTIVIADAALKVRSYLQMCSVTSMEESSEYAEATQAVIPARLRNVVTVIVSPKKKMDYGQGWIGIEYSEKPQLDWDFIFIDGPQLEDNSAQSKQFDSDLLSITHSARKGFVAYLDGRASTIARLSLQPNLIVTRGKFLTKFEHTGLREP